MLLRRDEGCIYLCFLLRPVGFCFSKALRLCHLGVTKSACPTDAEKCPPTAICPHSRWRSQPLSSVSRKQRYNTLDFPAENRVPTGMLAPLLETQRQRDVPFEIPHFLRRRICKLQKQQLENKKTLQSSPYNWTKIAAFYHTQCKQKVGSHFNSIDIRYPISTNITITER